MIESCRCPILCGMTVSALVAKSSCVRVILFMTGGAVHGRADNEGVNMTGLTSNSSMLAIQFECEFRMINRPIPSFCHMTQFALRAKFAIMLIILFMAGEAI